jgi:chloramphenicol-sensitive protein RarD
MTEQRKGLLQGVLAYGLWGVVAAYWKPLSAVDPIELIAHRAVWGLGAFMAFVAVTGQLGALRTALRDIRTVGVMAASGALLAINWALFVWATISGHLLDASLGYFINPLVSVALGTIVLRERLSRLQWLAIGFASLGVAILTWRAGTVPWIALLLASTFGLYGLVRKTAKVPALLGSTIETLLMVPLAVTYLIVNADHGAFGHADATITALLIGTGVVTAVPLVLFTSSARRLPLSTIGFLQYLAPTGHFILAITLFDEPLALGRLAAFIVIWTGLVAFTIDLYRQATRNKQI